MTEPQDSTNPEPTIERVRVTHVPSRYGERITHPWQWELTAPDGEVRYFGTKREASAWWDENKPAGPATYPDVFEAAEAAQEAADETGVSHHVRKERATGLLVVQPTEPVDGDRFLTVWGPAEPTDPQGHLAHARYLGADAALSSVVDHYLMSESDARSILDDVDPEVMDRYPEPTLSGEWADDPTPQSLAYEVSTCPDGCTISAPHHHGDDTYVDAVADAWEEGRDAVWGDALQATALRVLGGVQSALELERDIENRVDALRIKSERAS